MNQQKLRILPHQFNQVVFSGGGNRCFWQAGFWQTISEPLNLKPQQIAAVSAGSAIACMLFANRTKETLTYFKQATRKNKNNIHWRHLFKQQPMFPHAALYRQVILSVIDQEALSHLHQGPDIRIQLAQIPSWLGPRSGAIAGLLAYKLEKQLRQPIHPKYGQRIGFKAAIISVHACSSPESLADIILASSCTPPFTPIAYYKNQPVLDGGIVDNVPVDAIKNPSGYTLVLLSRRYKHLAQNGHCYYVQPSKPLPISSWDYTNPNGIQSAFDLGCYDGEHFLKQYDDML